MQLQQNPLKLECPIIPEIDSPQKVIRISSLIFMELFTEILILVQCVLQQIKKHLNFHAEIVLNFWRENSNIRRCN